jgi:cytochrome c oxidase assembly factor CtaG
MLCSCKFLLMSYSVTGSCAGVTLVLFVLYNNWILQKVKEKHFREVESEYPYETPVEMMKRKAKQPGLEPGSVV